MVLTTAEAQAAPNYDRTFGNQGRVIANAGMNEVSRSAKIEELGTLPDGGFSLSVQPDDRRDPLTLKRFRQDGQPDGRFAEKGSARFSTGLKTLMMGRKTLVAGTIGNGTPGQDTAVWLLKPNGKIDRSFGKNGLVRIKFDQFGLRGSDSPRQLVLGSDGNILISNSISCHGTAPGCGYTWNGFGLVLLSPNGKIIRMNAKETQHWGGIVAADNGTFRSPKVMYSDAEEERTALFRIGRDLKITEIREPVSDSDWTGPIRMLSGNSFYAFSLGADNDGGIVRVNANGTVDSGFSRTGCPGSSSQLGFDRSIEIDSEGRLLVQGLGDCDLLRVLPDGGLDPTFGGDGTVQVFDPEVDSRRFKLASTPAGKILVASWQDERGRVRVQRLNQYGDKDTDFAIRVVPVLQASNDVATAVADAGAGYLVAGNSTCGGYEPWSAACGGFFLARFKSNGGVDTSFGKRGYVSRSLMEVRAIASGQDGSIFVVGSTTRSSGPFGKTRQDLSLARFTKAGKLDHSFGENGLVITDLPGNLRSSEALSLAVQSDGRILVTGSAVNRRKGTSLGLPVLRYNRDGSLDQSFGKSGLSMSTTRQFGKGAEIQAKGSKILVATSVNNQPAVVRLRSNGSLDPSFGQRGVAVARLAVRSRFGRKVVFTPSRYSKAFKQLPGGRILVSAIDGHGLQDGALFRLKANGRLDRSFGRQGIAYTGGLAVNSLTSDKCGRVTAAGTYRPKPHSGRSFGLTQISGNGAYYPASADRRVSFPFGRERPSWSTSAVSGKTRTVIAGAVKRSLTGEDLAMTALKQPSRCR